MSGQQEQGTELDRLEQPDQSDDAPEVPDLIGKLHKTSPAKGSNGNGSAAITGSLNHVTGDSAPPPRPEPRPEPGSLADLRQRLERLPYGHPSSPYHADGEPKPPPPRLKHLELAPPAPVRFAKGPGQSADSGPVTAGPLDYEPDRPDSPAEPSVPVDVSIAAALPAPHTDFDGSWTWGSASLTADQARVANDAYDKFRAAEGRNLFGSYGGTGLTVVVRQIADGLRSGHLAPAAEQNSLLDPDAFKARFADLLARYPDRTVERLARRVPGAISYSFIFDREHYSGGIGAVQDALAARGFQLLARRNDWQSPTNRCVATMWQDPSSGLPFEVQFHTAASHEAQQLTRTSVTLISDPRIPPAEAASLRADLAAAWAAVPAPPGNGQIDDYRKQPPTPAASSEADLQRSGRSPDRSTP